MLVFCWQTSIVSGILHLSTRLSNCCSAMNLSWQSPHEVRAALGEIEAWRTYGVPQATQVPLGGLNPAPSLSQPSHPFRISQAPESELRKRKVREEQLQENILQVIPDLTFAMVHQQIDACIQILSRLCFLTHYSDQHIQRNHQELLLKTNFIPA